VLARADARAWLETLGRSEDPNAVPPPDDDAVMRTLPSIAGPDGRVTYAPPAGDLTGTPARFDHGPVVAGSDPPRWLDRP